MPEEKKSLEEELKRLGKEPGLETESEDNKLDAPKESESAAEASIPGKKSRIPFYIKYLMIIGAAASLLAGAVSYIYLNQRQRIAHQAESNLELLTGKESIPSSDQLVEVKSSEEDKTKPDYANPTPEKTNQAVEPADSMTKSKNVLEEKNKALEKAETEKTQTPIEPESEKIDQIEQQVIEYLEPEKAGKKQEESDKLPEESQRITDKNSVGIKELLEKIEKKDEEYRKEFRQKIDGYNQETINQADKLLEQLGEKRAELEKIEKAVETRIKENNNGPDIEETYRNVGDKLSKKLEEAKKGKRGYSVWDAYEESRKDEAPEKDNQPSPGEVISEENISPSDESHDNRKTPKKNSNIKGYVLLTAGLNIEGEKSYGVEIGNNQNAIDIHGKELYLTGGGMSRIEDGDAIWENSTEIYWEPRLKLNDRLFLVTTLGFTMKNGRINSGKFMETENKFAGSIQLRCLNNHFYAGAGIHNLRGLVTAIGFHF